MRRTSCLACFMLSIAAGVFLLTAWATAAETEAARTAALVEGAKKEGKLLWYSAWNIGDSDSILKKFKVKYPFIATEFYKATDEAMLSKILVEAASKKSQFDVVLNSGQPSLIAQKKGLYAKYLSPERKFFPDELKDPEGYWTDVYMNLNVLGYHTKLVPPPDAPRNYQDLLNPKWRGKIAIDPKAFEWFASTMRMMGEDKGLAFMKKLADQNLKVYSNRTVLAQMVAAGEVAISPVLYNHRVEEMKAKGAPLEWVGLEPVVPELHPVAVSATAPHPNAAKLLVDFILSREGQEMVATFYRIPSRIDVEPLIPRLKKGIKLAPFDPTLSDNYNRYVKLYREVLMRR